MARAIGARQLHNNNPLQKEVSLADKRPANIALLIDADNASHVGIDPVLTVLAELGAVNIRRAYGNWKNPLLKGWEDKIHRYGIEPQQQFDITKGKNATDMKMTIDAMDLLHSDNVEGFGIMSSDSDFMPLVTRLKQHGHPVYGFGSAHKTPEGFRQACSRFIDVDALIRTHQKENGGSGKSAAKNAASAQGKNKAASNTSPDDSDVSVTSELIDLLIDAYDAAKRDDNGFAALSQVGQLAGNRSSFDVRNYGFSSLSEMIDEIDIFQSERRDGAGIFVKRIR